MRLAKELGIPNVNEMLKSISGNDLIEWMAYAKLEPFGEERADLRMGILAALIANVNRDSEKTDEFTPQQFMPKFEDAYEEVEPLSQEDVAQKVDIIFSALAMMDATPSENRE